jgi:hypothetical protein
MATTENFIGTFSGDNKDWKPFFHKAYAKVKNILPELLHPCGLLPELVGPEICQQDEDWVHDADDLPVAYVRPRPVPDLQPGATATEHAVHKDRVDLYRRFLAYKSALTSQVRDSIAHPDDQMRLNLLTTNPRGYLSLSPIQIMTEMMATYGTITEEDLNALLKPLSTPYDPLLPFKQHVTTYRKTFFDLAAANHPVARANQVTAFIASLHGHGKFSIALTLYRGSYPAVASRNFEDLVQTLLTTVPDTDTDVPTPGATAHTVAEYAAAVRVSAPPSPASVTAIEALAAAVAKHINLSRDTPKSPRARGNAPRGANPAARGAAGGPPTYGCRCYCWTHGPQDSHPSSECRTRADGHQVAASFRDMMGGRTEPRLYGRK